MTYRIHIRAACQIITFLVLGSLHLAHAQTYLYPFTSGEQFGLIDAEGQERVAPKYERALASGPEGIAAVKFDGRWGFVDSSGEWKVDPIYDEVFPFVNQRAIVKAGKYWGLIDTEGTEVVPLAYLSIRTEDGDSYAVLDEAHVRILGIKISTRREWGFIDRDGQWILKPFYLDALPFGNGIAAVKLPRKALLINIGTTWAFVDTTGQFILEPGSRSVRSFSEGRAFTVRDGIAKYIDTSGATVFTTDAERAFDFADSRGRFFADGKWGYYNPQGEIAIEPLFDQAQDFSEGLAAVKDGLKWGFIDVDGRWVIAPQFERAWPFAGERSRVSIEGVPAYINTEGRVIWSVN